MVTAAFVTLPFTVFLLPLSHLLLCGDRAGILSRLIVQIKEPESQGSGVTGPNTELPRARSKSLAQGSKLLPRGLWPQSDWGRAGSQ